MGDTPIRRIELVEEADNSASEAARTGAGLIVGFVLGRNSLFGAATGAEQFEFAIAHFVGIVLASVAGALFLGAMYDRMSRAAAKAEADSLGDEDLVAGNDLMTPATTELPSGMPR